MEKETSRYQESLTFRQSEVEYRNNKDTQALEYRAKEDAKELERYKENKALDASRHEENKTFNNSIVNVLGD